jgi:hypothetical protein
MKETGKEYARIGKQKEKGKNEKKESNETMKEHMELPVLSDTSLHKNVPFRFYTFLKYTDYVGSKNADKTSYHQRKL